MPAGKTPDTADAFPCNNHRCNDRDRHTLDVLADNFDHYGVDVEQKGENPDVHRDFALLRGLV